MKTPQRPLIIWRVIDGRPGHENQSLGLMNALSRRIEVEVIDVVGNSAPSRKPDIIVGAGHKTHWRILKWSFRYRAFSIVIMKPTLSCRFFDLCIIPQHDLQSGKPARNVVPSMGAMNTILPGEKQSTPALGVILVGGPSKEYDWDGGLLRESIQKALGSQSEFQWVIANSRRTPEGFLESLGTTGAQLQPHQETQRGWLPEQLGKATSVWVTQDSVSMIYEALTSGASVGILPMPAKKQAGRVAKGIQKLIESHTLRTLDSTQPPDTSVPVLDEANRCAKIVLDHYFQKNTHTQ